MSKQRDLPKGVYKRCKRFMAAIVVDKRWVYLGFHKTPEDALATVTDYRKLHNIPAPKMGRPKKTK